MKRKNISLDIPTRWNSTYKILQNITKYKKVVQLYEMQLSKNNNNNVDVDVLNDYDWHIADLLRYLLKFLILQQIFFVVCIIQLHIGSLCK